jgi:hypothetical protein
VLSETERKALRGDPAAGVNVTVKLQDPPTARLLLAPVGQELAEIAKSPGLLPLIWKALNVRGTVPVLLIKMPWLTIDPRFVAGKETAPGLNVTAGGVVPVPLSITVCGESAALSIKVSAADLFPTTEGVKTNPIVQ